MMIAMAVMDLSFLGKMIRGGDTEQLMSTFRLEL